MLRVRMLTNIAGHPSYHSGEIVDLEERFGKRAEEVAKEWIADGLAAIARDEKPVERATK